MLKECGSASLAPHAWPTTDDIVGGPNRAVILTVSQGCDRTVIQEPYREDDMH